MRDPHNSRNTIGEKKFRFAGGVMLAVLGAGLSLVLGACSSASPSPQPVPSSSSVTSDTEAWSIFDRVQSSECSVDQIVINGKTTQYRVGNSGVVVWLRHVQGKHSLEISGLPNLHETGELTLRSAGENRVQVDPRQMTMTLIGSTDPYVTAAEHGLVSFFTSGGSVTRMGDEALTMKGKDVVIRLVPFDG